MGGGKARLRAGCNPCAHHSSTNGTNKAEELAPLCLPRCLWHHPPERALLRPATWRNAPCPWHKLPGGGSSGGGWPLARTLSGHTSRRAAQMSRGGTTPLHWTWPGTGQLEALPEQGCRTSTMSAPNIHKDASQLSKPTCGARMLFPPSLR